LPRAPSIEVGSGERPDLAVLSFYGRPVGIKLSLRHRRPRWPYCSRPWCPNNMAYMEGPGVYVPATRPSSVGGRVRVYAFGSTASRAILSLAPGLLSPGGIHGAFRARLHRLVTWAAQRMVGLEPLPASRAQADRVSPAEVVEVEAQGRVLVVGGGLAGIRAALEAARHGLRVILVEQFRRLGGFLRLVGGEHARRVSELESLASRARVTVLDDSTYIGYYDEGHAVLSGSRVLVARKIPVVYAGGSEAPPPLTTGNDLPGLVSSQYALELSSLGYTPRRAAVIGDGPWALEVAEALAGRGSRVYIVSRKPPPTARAEPVESSSVELAGSGRVEKVRTSERTIEVDLAVSAVDEYPDASPVYGAGYRPAFYPSLECFGPEPLRADFSWILDRALVIPAGSSTCENSVEAVEASGALAGAMAAWISGKASEEDVAAAMDEYERHSSRGAPSSHAIAGRPRAWVSAGVGGLQYVDLEEDITLADLLEAWDRGYNSMEKIKRATGLGTGLDQGRFSAVTAALVLSHVKGVPAESIGLFKSRPPHTLLDVGLLGGG